MEIPNIVEFYIDKQKTYLFSDIGVQDKIFSFSLSDKEILFNEGKFSGFMLLVKDIKIISFTKKLFEITFFTGKKRKEFSYKFGKVEYENLEKAKNWLLSIHKQFGIAIEIEENNSNIFIDSNIEEKNDYIESLIKVEDSLENFKTWSDREYIPELVKRSISQSNVLIVPLEGFREFSLPLFPKMTERIYSHLKKRRELDIEICYGHETELELTLHSSEHFIGHFVVKKNVLPSFIEELSTYIESKIILQTNKNKKIEVKFDIVDESGNSKKLTFEGTASHFRKMIEYSKGVGDEYSRNFRIFKKSEE